MIVVAGSWLQCVDAVSCHLGSLLGKPEDRVQMRRPESKIEFKMMKAQRHALSIEVSRILDQA